MKRAKGHYWGIPRQTSGRLRFRVEGPTVPLISGLVSLKPGGEERSFAESTSRHCLDAEREPLDSLPLSRLLSLSLSRAQADLSDASF